MSWRSFFFVYVFVHRRKTWPWPGVFISISPLSPLFSSSTLTSPPRITSIMLRTVALSKPLAATLRQVNSPTDPSLLLQSSPISHFLCHSLLVSLSLCLSLSAPLCSSLGHRNGIHAEDSSSISTMIFLSTDLNLSFSFVTIDGTSCHEHLHHRPPGSGCKFTMQPGFEVEFVKSDYLSHCQNALDLSLIRPTLLCSGFDP